jgi:DNA topoisomerase-3
VQTYKVIEDAEVLMKPVQEAMGICPCCGKSVVEKSKGFFCESGDFALWKNNKFFDALGKKLTKQIAEKLIKDGRAKLKGCKSAKTGKTYDCTVVMTVEDGRCNFRLEFDNGR